MRGYRPDPALVVSAACVMYAVEHLAPEEAEAIALAYLQRLFSRIEPPGDAGCSIRPGYTEGGLNAAPLKFVRPRH